MPTLNNFGRAGAHSRGSGRRVPVNSQSLNHQPGVNSIDFRVAADTGRSAQQRETQRAHAAVAGVSSYFPKVSPKNQPAPALSDLQAHSATPSISGPSPLTDVSFAPATASAPTEPPKHWPVVLPAPAPPARNVSPAPRTPASSPSAHGKCFAGSASVQRGNSQRREVPAPASWVSSSPHTGQKFRQWWLITLSSLRRSATPTPEVHQRPAYRHWKNVHQKRTGFRFFCIAIGSRSWIGMCPSSSNPCGKLGQPFFDGCNNPQFGPPALADPSFGDLCDTYHNKAGFHVSTHGGPQRL